MGIASRETEMQNIKGDYDKTGMAHGYGIMQIDIGSYSDFIKSGDWADPKKNIMKGAEVLNEKRRFIEEHVGKKVSFKSHEKIITFIGLSLTSDGLLRTAVASYNNGVWPFYAVSVYGDPDLFTTGRDYSCDVVNRTEAFGRLVAERVASVRAERVPFAS
jgi:hypothetical protein